MRIMATNKFKELRMKKGYTILTLAENAGMSRQALGQVERRHNGISLTNSQKVLELLGVEFDEVFEISE